jgi:uncharacterized protein (TIGR00369 family)
LPHPNPEYISELIGIVNNSPFPDHMSMKLVSIALDKAVIELKTGHCHLQPFGMVHGGVFATLVDTATFWAAFLRIPEQAGLVNIDLKLNYLQPVEKELLRAEGSTIRSGNSISYAESRVLDENGKLIAHGTSTLMTLPGRGLTMNHRKFITGGINH